MAEIVNLAVYAYERQQRQEAEQHARALVLFECAAALARQENEELIGLIKKLFGNDWLDERIKETLTPLRRPDAPKHARTKRAPK